MSELPSLKEFEEIRRMAFADSEPVESKPPAPEAVTPEPVRPEAATQEEAKVEGAGADEKQGDRPGGLSYQDQES